MTWQELAALASALGIGSLLSSGVPFLWRWITGAEKRRRTDADKAWEQRDTESRRRRRIEEHAHELRRMLIEAPCIKPSDIPSWPSRGIETKEKE